MEKQETVKVNICGRGFSLTSGDDPEYLIKVAKKVDRSIVKLMKGNIGLTFDQAAVLVALKYCDDYEKKKASQQLKSNQDENLGKRLVEYSKELTRATAKIKALEKEISKLKKEQDNK